jgi:heme/copper-type cytochrome/quinol oxidase subunit 1
MDMTIFAVHILGMSSIMGSINIVTTILNLRTPGMTLMKMPLFCWTWLVTAFLLIASMPILAGAVTMLLTDRHFGTTFFNALPVAVIRCCSSTSSGFSATLRSISSPCRPSASFPM